MKRNITLAVSVIFFSSSTLFAQSRTTAPIQNTYAAPVVTTTLAGTNSISGGDNGNGDTLQTTAQKSKGNNTIGLVMGIAAAGFCAVKVATSCPLSPSCPLYVAGLAASIIVTMMMTKSKKQSADSEAAVTTDPSTGAIITDNGLSTNTQPDTASLDNNPDWKAANKALADLRSQGWDINTNTGQITDPNGKKFSTSTFDSPASMAAAGYSASQIKDLTAETQKMQKEIAAKAKAADASSDLFGDSGGGSGRSGTSPSGDSSGSGIPSGIARTGLEINRDPAQVAGMSKNFNGDPIGVSADSLFKMVDRRYELHEKKGSFLVP